MAAKWMASAAAAMRISELGAIMTEMLNQDSRPKDDQGLTREAWLDRAVEAVRPRFTPISRAPEEAARPAMRVTLLHERIHAADDCQSGHKGAFAEAATRLGFQGPMTQTPPGLDLTADVITLAEALRPFAP